MRLLFVLLALTPSLVADQASKEAKVNEILTLVNAESLLKQVYSQVDKQMDTMLNSIAAQSKIPPEKRGDLKAVGQKMAAVLADQLSWEKLQPTYVKIYEDVYTEEELDGLLAFYRSPVGKSFLSKTPVILQKSVEAMQSRLPQIMREVQKVAEDSIRSMEKP
jgi:uncharacterized protein